MPSISDSIPSPKVFENLEEIFSKFEQLEFKQLAEYERQNAIHSILLNLIEAAPLESYLLNSLLDFTQRVNQNKLLAEPYSLSQFEFWINHHPSISEIDNLLIRGKIVGKSVPRAEYQLFFPVGMNKVYPGTHFVVAHLSPDVDTLVASFWGWMDAFACRVGTGIHTWSLPGGPPESPISNLLQEIVSGSLFSLPRTSSPLTLSALDLVTKERYEKQSGKTLIRDLNHGWKGKALILVDEEGYFIGDWRNSDVEPVSQVIFLFQSCLSWLQRTLYFQMISLFANQHVALDQIKSILKKVFEESISTCQPVQELEEDQKELLHKFLFHILKMEEGISGTFSSLATASANFGINGLIRSQGEFEKLQVLGLFDDRGYLLEDRPKLFRQLEVIFTELDQATQKLRDFVEQLQVAIDIKTKVLERPPHYLTPRSDVEEIKIQMTHYPYLTVVSPQENGKLFPLGVIWASDLQRSILGTVTLRDFCNLEEVKMASYLSVISVIDHHKSSLQTSAPPLALLADAQSCNVLVAELAMQLNKKYSLGGRTQEEIKNDLTKQIAMNQNSSVSNLRAAQRLLDRAIAKETRRDYFVHPSREIQEYLFFLYAIFDDTDLLTKVSARDVECVAQLLNQLNALTVSKKEDIILFDDIPRNDEFALNAAKRILQNQETYALYKGIYASKEEDVSLNLRECGEGRRSRLFADTKEQGGCSRVGQIKIFSSNHHLFAEYRNEIMKAWIKEADLIYKSHHEIDLHMLMVSTIPSAEEVYQGKYGEYSHEDELWIWLPENERSVEHLASFISAFRYSNFAAKQKIRVELPSNQNRTLAEIFRRGLPAARVVESNTSSEVVILFYTAGSLNSRKTMVSPYLPRLIP